MSCKALTFVTFACNYNCFYSPFALQKSQSYCFCFAKIRLLLLQSKSTQSKSIQSKALQSKTIVIASKSNKSKSFVTQKQGFLALVSPVKLRFTKRHFCYLPLLCKGCAWLQISDLHYLCFLPLQSKGCAKRSFATKGIVFALQKYGFVKQLQNKVLLEQSKALQSKLCNQSKSKKSKWQKFLRFCFVLLLLLLLCLQSLLQISDLHLLVIAKQSFADFCWTFALQK